MSCSCLNLFTWQNKQESLKAFISVNLFFYLLVVADYSCLSLLSSVLIILVLVLNAYSLVHKSKSEDDSFEFVSRQTIEDWFVKVFETWRNLKERMENSSSNVIIAILALYSFNFLAGLFGTGALAWLVANAGFALVPQYEQNKEKIQAVAEQATGSAGAVSEMLYEMIPKYRPHN